MRMHLLSLALLMTGIPDAMAADSWVTMGEAAYGHVRTALPAARLRASTTVQGSGDGSGENVHLVRVPERDVERMARLLHSKLRHCGGFMVHLNETSARQALARLGATVLADTTRPDYTLSQEALVVPALAQMDEAAIADTIAALSAFPNRYYRSSHGISASDWLLERWRTLGRGREAISVEQYRHGAYPQMSVIATIAGSDLASEVVIVGGHMDSINISSSSDSARAPGADDNASGIASLTEVLRVLAATDYRPRRTIKLMAYAAEEVGLRGSQEIARAFKKAKVNVVGVVQLDMTNYQGSAKDIYLISDYTDADQNSFLAQLLAAYLPALAVGVDRCGYACSDHASWDAQGYVASMPFEASLGQDNPYIHGRNDTYANSGNQAAHALKFARLAAAFVIELGGSTAPTSTTFQEKSSVSP